ncbi:carboxypeptidase-like regulatory domain-containing protein [Patescibacteria group bacterium]|nr:carboxypeptidase-like regulatory domain-containing protein [Patescibacteria group bacterium]
MKKIIFISIIGVLALILGVFFLFFNTYTISGKVVDLVNKEAVEGIEVSFEKIISITNKEGVFQLKNIKKYQSGVIKIKVPTGYEELTPITLRGNVQNIEIPPLCLL